MEARKREEHKESHGLANGQHPRDKTVAAISLLYSQSVDYNEL